MGGVGEGLSGFDGRIQVAEQFESETIHILDLKVRAIIGINPDERVLEQALIVSLDIPRGFAGAAATDDLAQTIDYSAVAGETRRFIQAGRFHLLETLARRLAAHLVDTFGLDGISIRVTKPGVIADSGGAAVSLTLKGL